MSKTAFERYAPFIQEYIYRKKWTDLREVQVEACDAIFDTDNHLIIASGTASGKTEAAFFPILTLLHEETVKSVGIIYVGPLKALINDQFERLDGLLEDSNIPVWPWHGDVSQSKKNRVLKEAKGVLQITPESLEALLMRRIGDARRLFSDLRFIIIDEIHALMGTDRGLQVLCLISRLERIIGHEPRRIGLSATLNDYKPAMEFLSSESKRNIEAVGIQSHKRTVSLCIESFILPKDEKKQALVINEYNHFLYDNSHTQKCLIFTNSRSNAEKVIIDMKKIAIKKLERDIFHVHHGSISAALRHEAETALRMNKGPIVTAATLTLELGIDIGDLDSTIQIGAPYSCSSFVQRLGRSGRRTEKSQMMFVNLHEETDGSPYDVLPWDLLRAIAIIQLYLEERWVEPFSLKLKPYSLLAHQTLSVLMAYGELSPSDLAKIVLRLPAFLHTITQDEYKDLLRNMVSRDYLERMDTGTLILGLKGERLTSHYSFYAVFQESESYRVHSKEGEVGYLDSCPPVEEVFVLAGRSWVVVSIDEDRKIIYVNPIKSSRIPAWSGTGGHIHTKIVKRMRQVLSENTLYPYLRPNTVKLLEECRNHAKNANILYRSVVPYSAQGFYFCPWIGTKELQSVQAILTNGLKDELNIFSVSKPRGNYLQITSAMTADDFLRTIKVLEIDVNNPDMVLPKLQAPTIDKFDSMVPDDLLRKAFLYNEMDVPYAVEVIKNMAEV